jgi:molecular chaperone GrpE
MLPVLDDFDRAIVEINKSWPRSRVDPWEIKSTLVAKGLEQVDLKGRCFDADFEQLRKFAPSDEFKGKIVDVLEKDTN